MCISGQVSHRPAHGIILQIDQTFSGDISFTGVIGISKSLSLASLNSDVSL
jgi:hypothetical protein